MIVEEREGERNWLLTDSISGFRVDTIREASDGSLGDQTSRLRTRHAVVYHGLWCGLKSFTHHVNKYSELRVLWFFTPENKDFAAFFCGCADSTRSPGWPDHVKSICTNKVKPIDINDAASSANRKKCVFEAVCVCVFERGSVFGLGHSHLFPSRMDLMEATGQGADRFIRVVIRGCPVSQAAPLQLPGLLGSHDGLQVD